ncbi:hypothetical protein BT69DRAFT_1345049 [Atractiella rhizophila]|nr:hypothetical protein BT69DRAFT_1345049 [Atractiella rhizophila]
MSKYDDDEHWDPYAFQAELDMLIPPLPIASTSTSSNFVNLTDAKYFRNNPEYAKYGLGAEPPAKGSEGYKKHDPALNKLVKRRKKEEEQVDNREEEDEEEESRTRSISARNISHEQAKSKFKPALPKVDVVQNVPSPDLPAVSKTITPSSPTSPSISSARPQVVIPVKVRANSLSLNEETPPPSDHSSQRSHKRRSSEPHVYGHRSYKKLKLAQFTGSFGKKEIEEEGLGDGVEEVEGEEMELLLRKLDKNNDET